MMKQSGIYKITNTVNGKVYIGQSTWLKKRIGAHLCALRKNQHKNCHLQRAFNKYGEENFAIEVIEFCDVSMLDEREQYYIILYNSRRNGYNQNDGGQGNCGYIVSEATRAKYRENHADVSGSNNPMYGKSWKDYCTSEEIESRNVKIQKYFSEHPPETYAVICLNTLTVYPSVKSASLSLNVNESNIGACCRMTTKSCGRDANGFAIVCLYLKDYRQMDYPEVQKRLFDSNLHTYGANHPSNKQVVNLRTREIFDSVKEAAQSIHIKPSAISSQLGGRHASSGKDDNGLPIVWAFYEDYALMTDKEIVDKLALAESLNYGGNKPNARSVICLTTGKEFSTATEAAAFYHVDTSSLVKCCKGQNSFCGKLNGEKLIWEYAS